MNSIVETVTRVPHDLVEKWGRGLPTPASLPTDRLKWSGGATIPAVGDIVDVTMNGLGRAVVRGYVIERWDGDLGFLGVALRLLNPPDWWKQQNAERLAENPHRLSFIFGAELRTLCQLCSYSAGHDMRCPEYADYVAREVAAGNILADEVPQ